VVLSPGDRRRDRRTEGRHHQQYAAPGLRSDVRTGARHHGQGPLTPCCRPSWILRQRIDCIEELGQRLERQGRLGRSAWNPDGSSLFFLPAAYCRWPYRCRMAADRASAIRGQGPLAGSYALAACGGAQLPYAIPGHAAAPRPELCLPGSRSTLTSTLPSSCAPVRPRRDGVAGVPLRVTGRSGCRCPPRRGRARVPRPAEAGPPTSRRSSRGPGPAWGARVR
jgi:hypothetical protein